MKDESERPAQQPARHGAARGCAEVDELLDHARRYFKAAAQSLDRRKMQILVTLGLEYLKLVAQLERSRLRQRRAASRKRGPAARAGASDMAK